MDINKIKKNIQELKRIKILNNKYKTLAAAGVLALGTSAEAKAEVAENQPKQEPQTELTVSAAQKVLEQKDDIFQEAVAEMKKEGRFFVNVADLTDVIYLSNDSVQEYQIPSASKIVSVSLARENNITWTSTIEAYKAAYVNTSGSYYSACQYSGDEMKSMTLWTLAQKDVNCQEYARRCIASAKHLSEEETQSLIQAYIDAHERVVSGETSIVQTLTIDGKPLLKDTTAVATFINALDAAKENISNGKSSKKELCQVFYYKGPTRNNALKSIGLSTFTDKQLIDVGKTMDFPKIEYVFDKDACERYFLMKFDQNALKKVPVTSMPALFMAGIHGSESLIELKAAQNNQYGTLINKHSKHKTELATKRAKNAMNSAQKNLKKEIDGKTYYDLTLVEQYQQITEQPSTTAEKMTELAAEYVVESPKDSSLYTVVLSNSKSGMIHEISAPQLNIEPDLSAMPKKINVISTGSTFAYNYVTDKER